jgi:bisphosphoglycerate-dependent phosphoglycerate mutase
MGKYKIYRGQKLDGSWKIGATYNYPYRCQQQKLTNYHILEEHDCEKIVAIREIELQKEYGYAVDKRTYCGALGRRKDYTISKDTREKISTSMKGKKQAIGEKNGSAKFSENEIHYIRKLYDSKQMNMNVLSKKYNVDYSTMYAICKRTSWKHI